MERHSLLLVASCLSLGAADVLGGTYRPPLAALSRPMLQLEERLDAVLGGLLAPLLSPFGRRRRSDAGGQLPPYIGSWSKSGIQGADEFLDKAMGVPWVKRRAAITGKQSQRLWLEGQTVKLAIHDLRGTKTYDLIPDGKPHKGKGFMSLPMENIVVARAGGLDMMERYFVHLGGSNHLKPCTGKDCPVVYSRREVSQGKMIVAVERTLPCGKKVKMMTSYSRIQKKGDQHTS